MQGSAGHGAATNQALTARATPETASATLEAAEDRSRKTEVRLSGGATPSRSEDHRTRWALLTGSLLVIALAATGLLVGTTAIAPAVVLQVLGFHLGLAEAPDAVADAVVWSLRLPRIILAAMVGSALAIAGTMMQGMFRNPLASPGILGTSTGASLGAVVALATGLSLHSQFFVPLFAVLGALAALAVVTRLARGAGNEGTSTATLLLAGVALTSFLGALNSFLIARSWEEYDAARRIAYWTMGGIADRGWIHVSILLPGLLLGGLAAWLLCRDLDLMLEGDEMASALGVSVKRSQRLLLIATALLTGSAVAVSGVVGFVGLIVPHLVRLIVGPAHRRLLPVAALTGAWFLMGADLMARTLAAPTELHLGVVTAFVGAPFFLFLLARHRRETQVF